RSICRCVEKIGDGMHAAVMGVDARGDTLSLLQAPGLPEAIQQALKRVAIAKTSLPCGAATFGARERIVEKLTADKASAALHPMAAEHGIAAVWSFPVFGAAERVIGTLDVWLDQPRRPNTDELDRLGRMARLAGIAIKR